MQFAEREATPVLRATASLDGLIATNGEGVRTMAPASPCEATAAAASDLRRFVRLTATSRDSDGARRSLAGRQGARAKLPLDRSPVDPRRSGPSDLTVIVAAI
jgi:hypothetical protein